MNYTILVVQALAMCCCTYVAFLLWLKGYDVAAIYGWVCAAFGWLSSLLTRADLVTKGLK